MVVQEGAGGVGGVGAQEAEGLADEGPAEAAAGGARVAEQRQEVAEHGRSEEEEASSDDGDQQDAANHGSIVCAPQRARGYIERRASLAPLLEKASREKKRTHIYRFFFGVMDIPTVLYSQYVFCSIH